MLIIIFEAYVTNLGKYNEGELLSEPLKFPAATEEVQAVLKRIGVEGLRYEEYFMAEYVSDIPGLAQSLGEYADIDELNHLGYFQRRRQRGRAHGQRGRPHQSCP